MRTALGVARFIGCWLLIVVGGLGALMFGLMVILEDEAGVRITAAVLALIGGAMVYGGLRWRPRRRPKPETGPEPASENAERALARLERGEPVVLYPRRSRWALLLVLSAALFLGSLFMLAGGLYAVGIAGTLLFGTGVAASITGFVPRWAHLRIAPDGLVLRHVGRTKRWSWNDLENFTAYEIHHQYGSVKQVGFDRRDLTPERQSLWQTVTRGMSGVDGALPDTYGLRHDELAGLLNTARERYATEHGPSPSMLADRELQRRADAVRRDRIPVVTAALAVVCLVVFVMEVDAYGAFPDAQDLRDAGGASRDALAAGDWWTLLVANVLHVNPIHLVFNLAGLLIIGILLEREIGWQRFGLLCLVGGLASMSLGVLLQLGAGVVGVSGVVYAIAAYALLRDVHRTRGLGYAAWAMVPAGVIYTFLMPGVSIGAHLGGLIAGFALGYRLERARARRTEPALS